MIKEIKYKGFTATPSDYECPDGELSAAINLVPEDGELKPVVDTENVITLPSGQAVSNNDGTNYTYKYALSFVHKAESYKHIIFIRYAHYETDAEDDYRCQVYWYDSTGKEISDISSLDVSNFPPTQNQDALVKGVINLVLHSKNNGLSVSAIGNTLLITGDKEGHMHYIIWKDGKYDYLGDHLPEIYLQFGLYGSVNKKSSSVGFDGSSLHLQDPARVNMSYHKQIVSYASTKVSDTIMGLANAIVQEERDKGKFSQPFFIRYALRLYDDSLVMHSAPVLMNPCTTVNPWAYSESASTENITCNVMLVSADVTCRYIKTISDSIGNWKDLIKGVDIFFSNQMLTYDQGGSVVGGYEGTSLVNNSYASPSRSGRIGASSETARAADSVFVGTFNGNDYAQFRFQHICSNYVHSRTGGGRSGLTQNGWPECLFILPKLKTEQIVKNTEKASDFRYVCTIGIDELESYTTRKKIEFPDTKVATWGSDVKESSSPLSSLNGEAMTDDYHSHDYISPKFIYDYNKRLNLGRIERTLFNGFPLCCMLAYCNKRYNFTNSGFQFIDGAYDKYVVVTYIKKEGKTKKLVCNLDKFNGFLQNYLSDNSNGELQGESWGNYFFYPDPDAYMMEIIHQGEGNPWSLFHQSGEYFQIMLKKHETLWGAYAFIDYNTVRQKTGTKTYDEVNPSVGKVVINEYGKIYTSEESNPFVFGTADINTIGTGELLGISTAAKAMSQGQFGQFPLYAFTTEGVWALEVASDGSFSNCKPITRDVCINPNSITQLDSAVIFATDRGIMLLSGSDSICITDSIRSDELFSLSDLPGLNNVSNDMITTAGNIVPFMQFLQSARMLYDYTHQRIIVYNPDKDYAYVYSLKSKSWGMMKSNIKYGINSYPDCLAVDGGNRIINLSSVPEVSTETPVPGATFTPNALLVTRPIKLDAPDILKTIDTMIQRGHFRKGSVKSILYGSRDLFNWHLIYSSNDHYLRGFRGTPYKYFRVVLLCDLSKDESIFGCTVQYTPRLLDQPR